VARRPRTERRQQERALRKEVAARAKLASAAPGGAADRAIRVPSASVIAVQARSTPCVQCAGELELLSETVPPSSAPALRLARLRCRLCHTARELWFRIEAPLPS
jgi:hypothetical protein